MKQARPWRLMGALALSVMAVTAQAQDTQARAWAASCATCHGTQGHSQGGIPSLAGEDQAQLLQKMLAFKQGTLAATVMHQHTKGYSDAELARLAAYFSRQAR